MSTLYKCDRCQGIGSEPLNNIHVPNVENNWQYKTDRVVELCNSCVLELNKFADPKPIIVAGRITNG